jgi:hypothetical protein
VSFAPATGQGDWCILQLLSGNTGGFLRVLRGHYLASVVVKGFRTPLRGKAFNREVRKEKSAKIAKRIGPGFPSVLQTHYTGGDMSQPTQPNLKLVNAPEYRENYANSVQMRVNIWDFFLVFGTLQQQTETQVEIKNFQGIYLSPQQAKALLGLLQQNISGYESAFGEIKLDPRMNPQGPVH